MDKERLKEMAFITSLIKLAEWYWGDKITDMVIPNAFSLPSECYDIMVELEMKSEAVTFEPQENSNQLDMLEDKMIRDLETLESIEWFDDGKELGWDVVYQDSFQILAQGCGKTKNEARLDAIIDYLEGIK